VNGVTIRGRVRDSSDLSKHVFYIKGSSVMINITVREHYNKVIMFLLEILEMELFKEMVL